MPRPVLDKILAKLRRPAWRIATGLLILAVLAGLGWTAYAYLNTPTRFTVAVAPRGGEEAKLLAAYARALEEEKATVRLKVVEQDDVRESAEALSRGAVDFAVVRPDIALPGNGLTLAILREEALILVAPEASEIDDVAALAGKRLGVVAPRPEDQEVVRRVLQHYDLAGPALTVANLAPGEVEAAFRAKRVDALAFVGVPVSQGSNALVRAVSQAAKKIAVIPVTEADALALKFPALSAIDVPPGTLGGRPRQPDEEVKTVGISYRLMARSKLDRGPVSEFVRYLFQLRSKVAQTTTAVNLLKAPDIDTATSAALPNHQGAVDYYNREQLTFMDRYGDWIWILLFAGGGISSAAAWVARLFVRRRRELVDEVLDRLLCILNEVREARTSAELDQRSAEIDTLVTHAVRYARHRTTGTRTMTALIMAIDSARAALDERRYILSQREAEPGRSPASTSRHVNVASSGRA